LTWISQNFSARRARDAHSDDKRCEPAPWIEIAEDRPRPLSKLPPAKAFHDTLTVGALW